MFNFRILLIYIILLYFGDISNIVEKRVFNWFNNSSYVEKSSKTNAIGIWIVFVIMLILIVHVNIHIIKTLFSEL